MREWSSPNDAARIRRLRAARSRPRRTAPGHCGVPLEQLDRVERDRVLLDARRHRRHAGPRLRAQQEGGIELAFRPGVLRSCPGRLVVLHDQSIPGGPRARSRTRLHGSTRIRRAERLRGHYNRPMPPVTRSRRSAPASQRDASLPPDDARQTPAMRQFARFKRQHPDCVLFFRMGDFYEMFDDDAVLAHKALGITLTQRTEGIPMAGVPYHAVEGYLRRMIEQGYRVAVCEQIQDPKEAKGVVDRAVTRVLTPGTLVDESAARRERRPTRSPRCTGPTARQGPPSSRAAELSHRRVHGPRRARRRTRSTRSSGSRPSELLYAETADGSTARRRTRARVRRRLRHHAASRLDVPAGRRGRAAAGALRRRARLAGFGFADDDRGRRRRRGAAPLPAGDAGPPSVRGAAGATPPPRASSTCVLPSARTPSHWVTIDATSLRSLEIERTHAQRRRSTARCSAVLQRCRDADGQAAAAPLAVLSACARSRVDRGAVSDAWPRCPTTSVSPRR